MPSPGFRATAPAPNPFGLGAGASERDGGGADAGLWTATGDIGSFDPDPRVSGDSAGECVSPVRTPSSGWQSGSSARSIGTQPCPFDRGPTLPPGLPTRCKNLVVQDKAKRLFMLVAPERVVVNFPELRRALGAKRSLSMVSAANITALFPGAAVGALSPFWVARARLGRGCGNEEPPRLVNVVFHPALTEPATGQGCDLRPMPWHVDRSTK